MHSTLQFVTQLQQLWRQEPRPKNAALFWLTPEQRAAIIRELLYPIPEKQKE